MSEGTTEVVQPKKRRSYGPKSKFGCKTCRTRRYKCDETRPRCLRCIKDGFDCDGFPVRPVNPGSATGRQILPRAIALAPSGTQSLQRPTPPPGILIRPRTAVFEHNLEYQYFTEFRERTAAHIAGYYDKDVWDRIVPQICHQEASIRHLTVALAAVNMTISAITDSTDSTKVLDNRRKDAWRHTAFGLRQYARGLALMRRSTFADFNDEYQLRNALLSCFITMTFEFYQGNKEAAMKQGAAGIQLLNNFHKYRFGAPPEKVGDIPSTATIDVDIIATFAHIQSLLVLGQKRDFTPPAEVPVEIFGQIPSTFLDLKTALVCWGLTSNPATYQRGESTRPREEADFLFDISTPDFVIDRPLITSIPVKHEQLSADSSRSVTPDADMKIEASRRWLKAFLPLYNKCREGFPNTPDYQQATILMIRFLSGNLRIADSTLTKDYVNESLQVISLASELLSLSGPSGQERLKQTTRFLEQGIAAGLFLVAVKCQDHHIRRHAIALLEQHPGEEAYWDSIMAAKIATWFVEKEEQVARESKRESRFVIEYIYSLPERKVSICMSKQLKDEPHRILTPPFTLSW